jgi:ribonuclease HI
MSFLRGKHQAFIHTDGGCKNGVGGWAAVIQLGGNVAEISGSDANTTNNRMEMMAVIEGLKMVPVGSHVTLFTDSQYVQKGIRFRVDYWKKKQWKTANGEDVKNRDLWESMVLEASLRIVSYHWVKGHDGNTFNERCDTLARQARIQLEVFMEG